MRRLLTICLLLGAVLCADKAQAQHTLGVTGGYGSGTARFYPNQETRSIWGCYTGGLVWRYYGPQRFVGGFGLDLEYLERGFSYAPYASSIENKEDYRWYTRRVKSIVLPVVWQPHVYVLRHRIRIYLDLSAYFSYNLSATYKNEYFRARAEASEDPVELEKPWQGEYEFKMGRDNRWGYGLAGGGGIAFLAGRAEINLRVRYYFGYSDLMRNRNKYPGNATDVDSDAPAANAFIQTPLRSPIDNLTFSVGVAWRFNKAGFSEWENRPVKRAKSKENFDYQMK